jgi:hypothetical protein
MHTGDGEHFERAGEVEDFDVTEQDDPHPFSFHLQHLDAMSLPYFPWSMS